MAILSITLRIQRLTIVSFSCHDDILVLSWASLQSGVTNSFMSQPAPAVVYSLSYDPVAGKFFMTSS
jgi:hypothetical protein